MSRKSISFSEAELWALIQMGEASVANDGEMTDIELRSMNKLRTAHADLFKKRNR